MEESTPRLETEQNNHISLTYATGNGIAALNQLSLTWPLVGRRMAKKEGSLSWAQWSVSVG